MNRREEMMTPRSPKVSKGIVVTLKTVNTDIPELSHVPTARTGGRECDCESACVCVRARVCVCVCTAGAGQEEVVQEC